MSTTRTHRVTQVLAALGNGRADAASDLFALVYEELRSLARRQMAQQPPGHTLQPTALVHEAYLRLFAGKECRWENRAHFFCAAAEVMRRILVDHARRKGRVKRGGGMKRVYINDVPAAATALVDVLDLDAALNQLEAHHKRKCDVVRLRYFAGCRIDEIARILEVSPATVKNDWSYAKAWLHREISRLPHQARTSVK